MEKKTLKLEQIIRYLNGLNVIANAGVGIKDVETAFDISMFKAEAQKLFEAFQAASMSSKEEDAKKKNKELEGLLKKEYEIEVPTLKLETLKGSEKEIPLIAFDYLNEFIKR